MNDGGGLVNWSYAINSKNEYTDVEAITCDIYINKYLQEASSDQQKDLQSELFAGYENYLCPDTPLIEL